MKRPEPLLLPPAFPRRRLGGASRLCCRGLPVDRLFQRLGGRSRRARSLCLFRLCTGRGHLPVQCRSPACKNRCLRPAPGARWRADRRAARACFPSRRAVRQSLLRRRKLYAGIRFRSPWFGAAAVYYTVLSTMRFAVLRGVRNAPPARAVCRSCPADARAACLPALRCADVCPESGHDGHSRTNGLAEPRIPLSRHADLCLSRIYVLLLRQRSSQRGESAPHA